MQKTPCLDKIRYLQSEGEDWILSSLLEKLKNRTADIGKQDGAVEMEFLSQREIAIIGMAFRFPGAEDFPTWRRCTPNHPECATGLIGDRHRDAVDFAIHTGIQSNPVFARINYLPEIDQFDYRFFNLSPREAALMDPNQRMFLETAWHAMEDAGYGGGKLQGTKTGVFVGYRGGDFFDYRNIILGVDPEAAAHAFIGNLPSVIAGRISYLLDLKGPSLTLDTACSASLVAVHYACQSLRNGECDMALVGGIRLNILPLELQDRFGVESTDGKTRTFNDDSDGTGIGEGIVAILLKPLSKALRGRDHIYATIKGSAVNQDGNSVGLTAPNMLAQEDVLVRAWMDAGINPETITFIEAHGTGTKLGDPVEVGGICGAFRRFTAKKQFCAISSVKTNIGHLDNAAGIAGVVQAIWALQNRELPPCFHFSRPNRRIDFPNSPVYVNDTWQPWLTDGHPRRCGVSSFGFSGTNCHIVLEEAPPSPEGVEDEPVRFRLLTLSAKSEISLKRLVEAYDSFLRSGKVSLDNLCYTASTGRGHYQYRLAILFEQQRDLWMQLNTIRSTGLRNLPVAGVYYGNGEAGQKVGGGENQTISFAFPDEIGFTPPDREMLQQCAEQYVSGANVHWEKLFQNGEPGKISLPVYPFDHTRCWVEIPASKNKEKTSEMYFETVWERVNNPVKITRTPKIALVITDDTPGDKGHDTISGLLRKEGIKVLTADIAEKERSEVLQKALADGLTDIIFLPGNHHAATNSNELDHNLENGVYAIFRWLQSLLRLPQYSELFMMAVVPSVNEVTVLDTKFCPENAPIFGLLKTLALEQPRFNCRCLEVDTEMTPAQVAFALWDEIHDGTGPRIVAYRQGVRYNEVIRRVNTSASALKIEWRENGVYIITGGMGGIGLELGKHLMKEKKINLALISHSPLPAQNEWEQVMVTDSRLHRKILGVREMEKEAGEVSWWTADVSDPTRLGEVLAELRRRYGRINGIIHCAGKAGSGLLNEKEERTFRDVMAPKVYGTWWLDTLTRDDHLDFFILFSSFISLTGGPGQSDYVAANAYLDSFSLWRSRHRGKTLTLNWAPWKETGMAIDNHVATDGVLKAFPTILGLEAFDGCLEIDGHRFIVGAINYQSPLLETPEHLPITLSLDLLAEIEKEKSQQRGKPTARYPKVETVLKGQKEGPYSYFEQTVAKIWGNAFGLREITLEDKFYDLGGDSILALRIAHKLAQETGIKLEAVDLLRHNTVKDLATYLGQHARGEAYPPITPAGMKEHYPISPAQERMFVLNRMKGADVSDNISRVLHVRGRLDLERFLAAIGMLTKRHEALRTSFHLVGDEPIQKTHSVIEPEIHVFKAELGEIEALIDDFIRPFDLDRPPLWRVGLLELSGDEHLLLYDIHHIIADGFSVAVLIEDFLRLYRGETLLSPEIHYKDYAVWLRSFLHSDALKKQESYWVQLFTQSVPVLDLPTDFPRPEILSYEGDSVEFTLDPDMTRALYQLALDYDVTLFVVLLAVYGILLSKYCGQDDLVVGTPVSGRRHPATEKMVGMFVNTLPIRLRPYGSLTFATFLKQVGEGFLDACENEDYPFDLLVRTLGLERSSNRHPFFETMIEMQNAAGGDVLIGDLDFTEYRFRDRVTQFDLMLHIRAGERLHFKWLYAVKLYHKETVARMGQHLCNIYREVVKNPFLPLAEISMFSAEERQVLGVGKVRQVLQTMDLDFEL